MDLFGLCGDEAAPAHTRFLHGFRPPIRCACEWGWPKSIPEWLTIHDEKDHQVEQAPVDPPDGGL